MVGNNLLVEKLKLGTKPSQGHILKTSLFSYKKLQNNFIFLYCLQIDLHMYDPTVFFR